MLNLNLPKLLLQLSLISILLYAPIAEAKYRPRNVQPVKGPTGTTGVRGVCDNTKPGQRLTAIAPLSHVGETSINQPIVTWFVPESDEYTLVLRLWENDKIIATQSMKSKSGLMSATLPAPLQSDRLYRWQVSMICDPSRPSKNQVIQAPIIYTPSSLKNETEEYWYDALNQTLKNRQQYLTLLNDLKAIETEALTQKDKESPDYDSLEQHIKNLKALSSLP